MVDQAKHVADEAGQTIKEEAKGAESVNGKAGDATAGLTGKI